MWMFALCCAALGALLSVRFKAIALIPGSLIVVGLTAIFGTLHEWGASALLLMAMANVIVFQMAYAVGGLVLQVFGIKPSERHALGLWHKNSKL
jgi:hypothetical protein